MIIDSLSTEQPSELPENVIGINGTVGEELEIRLAKEDQSRRCAEIHRNIIVDPKTRTVHCEACGRTVEAFDYLLAWARDGEARNRALKNIEVKRKVAWAEWKLLDNRIKNHRATLKRAGLPQPDRERRLFDSVELNCDEYHRYYQEFLEALTQRLKADYVGLEDSLNGPSCDSLPVS